MMRAIFNFNVMTFQEWSIGSFAKETMMSIKTSIEEDSMRLLNIHSLELCSKINLGHKSSREIISSL